MATCYRHPNRETGVSCSNCGNPICPDCMTTTPVGMRCPDCSAQKTKVVKMGSLYSQPRATYVLIALNVLIYFGSQSGGRVIDDFALWGNSPQFGGGVAEGELYRMVTSGFLHGSLLHLAFNMYALYWLGNMLEPVMRTPKFVAIYFASMLMGSFGAILLHPEPYTVGASGAVFGLFAAAFLSERQRGFDPMASGIGPTILLNLAITFFPGLNISIGGHIGGLVGGAVAFWLMSQVRGRRSLPLQLAACVAVGAVAVAAAVAVADRATGLF
jgi:membrane associated rhomboid family serine protease